MHRIFVMVYHEVSLSLGSSHPAVIGRDRRPGVEFAALWRLFLVVSIILK